MKYKDFTKAQQEAFIAEFATLANDYNYEKDMESLMPWACPWRWAVRKYKEAQGDTIKLMTLNYWHEIKPQYQSFLMSEKLKKGRK